LKNSYLDSKTSNDIDKRITKILNDLDNPEPPLRLEIVRELLRLDFAFYSSSNTGAINETIHRLKVAGKQIIDRPALLIDAIRKWDLKALWVPDRKRILIVWSYLRPSNAGAKLMRLDIAYCRGTKQ